MIYMERLARVRERISDRPAEIDDINDNISYSIN
jgi:hypothetical protein